MTKTMEDQKKVLKSFGELADQRVLGALKPTEIMRENSIVRENLMNEKGYSPYCGNEGYCYTMNPRTEWNGHIDQFVCKCGWVSKFPEDFIKRYKEQWSK